MNSNIMKGTILHIKNMVCDRCIMAIKNTLTSLGVQISHVELGYAQVKIPEAVSWEAIASELNELGFELLQDKDMVLLEQIKLAVIRFLQMPPAEKETLSLSKFIASSVGKNYYYVSKLFSKVEGRTIEQYYIQLRVEKVKELIDYDEMSLGQIAAQLGYSSVHYLSSQFKKVTGISVSAYRKSTSGKGGFPMRTPIDKV